MRCFYLARGCDNTEGLWYSAVVRWLPRFSDNLAVLRAPFFGGGLKVR